MRVKDGGSRSWLVRALILVWNNAQTEPPGFRAGAVSGNFPVRLTHGREAQPHMRIVCCISHSDGSLTCGIPKLIWLPASLTRIPGTGHPAWPAAPRRYDVGREPAGRRYRR